MRKPPKDTVSRSSLIDRFQRPTPRGRKHAALVTLASMDPETRNEEGLRRAIRVARRAECSWEDIADVLGVNPMEVKGWFDG